MIASRIATGAAFALFSLTVSVDPAVTARGARTSSRRPAVTATRDTNPHLPRNNAAGSSRALAPKTAAAPPDFSVAITDEGSGYRVLARRPGHLLALASGATRAVGSDWASMRISLAPRSSAAKPAGASEAVAPLVWETTPLSGLTTERGLIALRLEGGALRAEAYRVATPEPAGTSSGPHHTCAAHRDLEGGFTVLCRLHHGVRRVSVANLTGTRVLDDAWVTADKDPLVRLDLPLAPGLAEARLVGFVHGATGAVLRAEASWVEGESASLLIDETERRQIVPSDF